MIEFTGPYAPNSASFSYGLIELEFVNNNDIATSPEVELEFLDGNGTPFHSVTLTPTNTAAQGASFPVSTLIAIPASQISQVNITTIEKLGLISFRFAGM